MGQTRKLHEPGELKPHVHKGDQVLVIAGRSKRHTGRVLSVDPQRERAIVEGVNIITKHQKALGSRSTQQQQSGRIQKPSPIHLSNLMVVCPGCNQKTRICHVAVGDKFARACKHCKTVLDGRK